MSKETIANIILILLGIAAFIYCVKTSEVNKVTIDTSKTDSMEIFYSKQFDSMSVENQLLQNTITNKDQTIITLKGLVKENNEKINPNNSVPILDSLRRSGFGKD